MPLFIWLKMQSLPQGMGNANDYTRCSARRAGTIRDHPATPFNPGPSGGCPQKRAARTPIQTPRKYKVSQGIWVFCSFFLGLNLPLFFLLPLLFLHFFCGIVVRCGKDVVLFYVLVSGVFENGCSGFLRVLGGLGVWKLEQVFFWKEFLG